MHFPTSWYRAALLGLALFVACEQQADPLGPDYGVLSVSIASRADTLLVGDSLQLTATVVMNKNQQPRPVTWKSAMSAMASVTSSGMVHGLHAGAGYIIASSGTRRDSAAVTVLSQAIPPAVALVAVSPPYDTLRVGATTQLTATPKDANGNPLTGRTITWASRNASVATVNGSGVVTTMAAGSTMITATVDTATGMSAVTVSPVPVASVTVAPATVSVSVGATAQLSAVTKDSAGNVLSGRTITWMSSDTNVARVSALGLVVGRGAGTATITATSEGKSGTASATVTNASVASVTISPATASLLLGATMQLSVTTKDSLGNILTGRTITWASSNTAVATVSAAGLVASVALGSATITATSEGKSGTAAVTVSSVPVASVTISPATATILVGATAQLGATTKDSAGNVLTGRSITWATSNSAVATVSATGLVTAQAAGTATITATSEGKSGTASITVALVPVASVTLSPATASIFVGATQQITATTKDSAGNVLTGRTISWASSNTAVATVSTSGLVTGKGAGTVTITATSEGKSGTASITVALVPVASVTVSPASGSIVVGGTLQLTATTKDSAGNVLTGRTITWASSSTALATVGGTGLVTGVAAGSATITATSGGKSGTATVTVTASTGTHAGWYASPSGSSGGDGSVSRPWDLQTGLNGAGGKIHAGDTLWLRGGTYPGAFSTNLNGTASAPIVVRQYPGERATIDGGTVAVSGTDVLTVNGSYTIYWGFEIMESNPQRNDPNAGTGSPLRGDGVYVNSAHDIKLINLIVHDTGHGTYTENGAHNIEIYGWIIYNGGTQSSLRSDGHGIYIKNDGIGWKIARDNVIFDQFGFGIHGYAESGTNLLNLVFDGNVLFNNGTPSNYDNPNMQLGGTVVADNDTVTNNTAFFSPGVTSSNSNVRIGYNSTQNGTATFANNLVVGGTQTFDVGYWSNLAVQGNTIVAPTQVLIQHDGSAASTQHWTGDMHYHNPTTQAWQLGGSSYTFANWDSKAGAADQASAGTPTAPRVVVRPNRYEAGRALVAIYNPTGQGAVSVDLTGAVAVGSHYDVRNVQDIFGSPVVSGTYGGGSISIPMSGVTPPQPIGGSFSTLLKTAPYFDAFIVTSAP